MRVFYIISFGLETEGQIKCESDGFFFIKIHGVDYHLSTIQLDAKSRNILFVVVEDFFCWKPFFFFF